MNLVCVSVCLSTFFSATKSTSFMKFWLKASFGPGWSMTKPDFRNFDFYGFYGPFLCFFKWGFSCFFSKISAVLTPRTMKFRHKDYFYAKKWHKRFCRKFTIFMAFFRYLSNTQIQKWCVCSWFPQPSNIRAVGNLEFKSKLDQFEK